jgi:hypothetical protein
MELWRRLEKGRGRFCHSERKGSAIVPQKETGMSTPTKPYRAGRSPTEMVPNK